jgi:hypothetical protein
MNMLKKLPIYLVLVLTIVLSNIACKKKSYPCPGLGQSSEADLSLFDEKGELKNQKGKKKKGPVKRVNHESGLVNKKSPKQIKAQRKKHI